MFKKKSIKWLFILSLIVIGIGFISDTCLADEQVTDEIDGKYYYYNTETKTATLTELIAADGDNVSIPATIEVDGERYTVNKIGLGTGYGSIAGPIELSSLSFPESIETIDDFAFQGLSIDRLVLPQGLKFIGYYSFSNVNSGKGIKELVLPDTLISIGDEAFENQSITSISFSTDGGRIIPTATAGETVFIEGIETIGKNAFSTNKLTGKVVLPESLNVLGESVFAGNQLQAIQFPSHFTATTIGTMMIDNVPSLDFLAVQPNITEISDLTFNLNSFSTVTIPSQITTIGERAFGTIAQISSALGLSPLEEVYLANQVTTIGNKAFYDQPLKFITVPLTQAEDLKDVLNQGALLGVTEATILREEGEDHYGTETQTRNDLLLGESLNFSVVSRNKYRWNLTTETLELYQPQVQWYKDGQPLGGAVGALLTLDNVTMADAGTYYAIIDGVQLEDLVVHISEQQEVQDENVPTDLESGNEEHHLDGNLPETSIGTNEVKQQQLIDSAITMKVAKEKSPENNSQLPNTGEETHIFWIWGGIALLFSLIGIFLMMQRKKFHH